MAEKDLTIDGLELHYEGVFNLKELLKAIDKYSTDKGYVKSEKRRQEIIRAEGKEFSMELRPTKAKSEYEQLQIKIRISVTELKKVEVVRSNIKRKMDSGKVSIVFDAWKITDFKNRWAGKPWLYFLTIFVDKFIYNFHAFRHHGELNADTHYIYNEIKSFLNLNKYQS